MEEKPVYKCHKKCGFGNSFNTCTRPVIKDKEMKQSREKQSKTSQKGGQLQHSSQFPGKHSTCWNCIATILSHSYINFTHFPKNQYFMTQKFYLKSIYLLFHKAIISNQNFLKSEVFDEK